MTALRRGRSGGVVVVAAVLVVVAFAVASPRALAQPADQPPQVVFATPRPATAYPCQPVILDASGSFDPDGKLTGIAWGIGYGPYGTPNYGPAQPITGDAFGQPPSTPLTTSVLFPAAGSYALGVQLTDDGGQTASATQLFAVNPAPPTVPVPLFSQSSLWQYVGHTVSFDAGASYESGYDASCNPIHNHALTNYTWDFGDGTVISAGTAAISHTYTTPGLYTVILRVSGSDPNGGQAAATHSVLAVTPPPPAPAVVGLPAGPLHADRSGHIKVRVGCRQASAGCVGELLLTAVKPGAKAGTKPVVVAGGAFIIARGKAQTLVLALTEAGRGWLRSRGTKGLAAALSAIPLTAAVPLMLASERLTITAPPPPRRKTKRSPKPRKRHASDLARPQLRNL